MSQQLQHLSAENSRGPWVQVAVGKPLPKPKQAGSDQGWAGEEPWKHSKRRKEETLLSCFSLSKYEDFISKIILLMLCENI